MDRASVITYSGDLNLFEDLELSLVQAVPKESTEWKRPYGRAVKNVFLDVHFVPFSKDLIPKSGDWKLIGQPILHTYWTECSDVETYKTTVKADIEQWLKNIGSADWMIILVEVYDSRKSNKLLPRTTVIDKIRADFAVKQGDRVLALIHPIKSESKSAESWRGMVNRLRVLLLQAYNKTLSKFEETIRANRECRPQPTWSFCSYFTMQEELALVLEMLGLCEEALVQYDELDALFTQFVLNSMKCEMPKWLASFTVPLQKWAGPTLSQRVTSLQRDLLRCSKLDLLQFRSYLFGRQSSLLLRLNKPWEVAQRASTFLHNCVQEMKILEVSAPDGALATWVFLVCLEVLRTCEKFKESSAVEAYSQYTAELWAYARDKLKELGELCGLTPGPGPSSDQLHVVVQLASGMGDPRSSTGGPTPVDRLKEALSSKDAFNCYFLELSELSISTYKHIGRLRSARIVGMDLAEFYLGLNQPDKAATFLSGALKCFQDDHWSSLAASTMLKLVHCFSVSSADVKYTMCCASIACSTLDEHIRVLYFNKFAESIRLFAQEPSVVTSLGDVASIENIVLSPRYVISRGECVVEAEVTVLSRLPGPISIDTVSISVERGSTESSQRKDDAPVRDFFKKLPMFEAVDYKQDGSLHGANIICREPQKALRRTDSHGRGRKVSTPTRRDFTFCLVTRNVTLNPGENVLNLTWRTEDVGRFILSQFSLRISGLELLEPIPHPHPEVFVEKQKSLIEIRASEDELLAGLPQNAELLLDTGSYAIEKGTPIHLTCSKGLKTRNNSTEGFNSELDLILEETEPFSKVSVPLSVLAELPSPSDGDVAAPYKIIVYCGWCDVEYSTTLTFLTPLRTVTRLSSVAERKYLHMKVSGLSTSRLLITAPKLDGEQVQLRDLNVSRGLPLIIGLGLNSSLLWEMSCSNPRSQEIGLTFTVNYRPAAVESTAFYPYKCHFNISNFKTLFVVRCSLASGKEADFCRVGAMCQLNLEISRSEDDLGDDGSLMYEVFADQAMWAICGRAAGVMTVEKASKQSVLLEVMPLTQGFLPLPHVRLSRYIPASDKESGKSENSRPRLEPFSPGQVYSASKCEQIHVLPAGTAD